MTGKKMNTIPKNSSLKIDVITSFNHFFNDPTIIKNNPEKVLGVIQNDQLLFYVIPYAHVENISFLGNGNILKKYSFIDIANEWLFQKSKLWTSRHLNEIKRRLNKDIFPVFRHRDIATITSQDILEVIRKIEMRHKYDLSHRILRDIQSIMRYAISIGAISSNFADPLKDALIPHVVKNQKTIHKDQLPQLLKVISSFAFKEGSVLNYAFQLLALTFVRAQELMGAEWSEFNLEEKLWIIPKERMKKRKEHIVFLSEQSCLVLENIRKEFFHPIYVFYDQKRNLPIKIERLINSLYKIGYKGQMTAHGFRALASTILNEAGFNPDVIERQLAHVDANSVRRAYNRAEYIEDRNRMMQWWGNFIAEQCPLFNKTYQVELNLK